MDLRAGSRESLARGWWLSLCTAVCNYTLASVTIMLYFFYGKGHRPTMVIITLLVRQTEEDSVLFCSEFCGVNTAILASPVT